MKTNAKAKGTFTSEIHVGLLVLILILLSLNFLSNYYLFRQRSMLNEQLTSKFDVTTIGIARTLSSEFQLGVSDTTFEQIRKQFSLSGILLAKQPSPNAAFTQDQIVAKAIPEGEDSLFINACTQITDATLGFVSRGYQHTYLFPCHLKERNNTYLLVMAVQNPELAYLEDAGQVLFYAGFIGMLLCFGLYFVIYRMFVKPFRVLSDAAKKAGKGVDPADDTVEAVIAKYQQIIDELQEKEQELRGLHKAAQERASSVEGFNQYIVGSMQTGLLSCSADGKIVALNTAGAAILETEAALVVGHHIDEIFVPANTERRNRKGVFAQQETVTWREIEIITQSKAKKIVGYAASHISDETNRKIGYCILFSDITELTKLRLELEQNRRQAALGEMAAGLAHQLRNSLGAIVGYGRLIRRSPGEQSSIVQHSETLVDEASQANELITRFLELSRPMALQEQTVEIEEFVESVIASLRMRKEYQERTISMTCHGAESARFDPLLMKQVLTNILENSLQASSETNGAIRISVMNESGQLLFSVTDTGKGIPADVMEKLFTPFFSSRPDGTGLGLAVARRIVDLHGGKLSIESTVGKGTTCTIALPQSVHTDSSRLSPAYS